MVVILPLAFQIVRGDAERHFLGLSEAANAKRRCPSSGVRRENMLNISFTLAFYLPNFLLGTQFQ
jgi:hypothetical protein